MSYVGNSHSITEEAVPTTPKWANIVRSAREARGYSLEDLAVTSGLTMSEIAEIENGNATDFAMLRRIVHALQLPETSATIT